MQPGLNTAQMKGLLRQARMPRTQHVVMLLPSWVLHMPGFLSVLATRSAPLCTQQSLMPLWAVTASFTYQAGVGMKSSLESMYGRVSR